MAGTRENRTASPASRLAAMCLVPLAILALALGPVACAGGPINPSGDVKTETRKLESFDEVTLAGVGKLRIVPGDEPVLEIKADSNVMPYIESEVVDGSLTIGIDTVGRTLKLDSDTVVEFELTAPIVTAITNTGSGSIAGGAFGGTLFTLTDTGSGDIALDEANVVSLSSTISGSGSIEVKGGVTGAQVVSITGSGSYSAPGLDSKVATVRVTGSGHAEVWASEGLDATITGSGTVGYWGSPRLSEDTQASSGVKKLGDK